MVEIGTLQRITAIIFEKKIAFLGSFCVSDSFEGSILTSWDSYCRKYKVPMWCKNKLPIFKTANRDSVTVSLQEPIFKGLREILF